MKKEITHYCIGHKKKLTLDDEYYWNKIKKRNWHGIKRRNRFYCNQCEYCEGCKRIHPTGENGGGVFRGNPTKFWCYKWTKPSSPSPMKRAENLSPAEVLSGVHLGYEGGEFKGADQRTRSEEVKQIKEAVKELG